MNSALPRYLYELLRTKRWLPRRQEAEDDTCEVRGETKSALVAHQEIREWGLGKKDAMICSISHAWETREHPDPLRFQLENLVNGVSLYDAAYFSEIWLFYDYVSLFQWQRKTTKQERSFRRAMGNMHLLYAHQSSLTFRLERLTPPDVWSAARNDETFRVPVYHEASGAVVFIPLRDLVENRVDYNGRGWCLAEKEWSAARSILGQNVVMDGEADESGDQKTKKIPTAPDAFIYQMATSNFTHRNDQKDVVHLQEKIFHEKVTVRKQLKLSHLTHGHMVELTGSLPHYRSLRVLEIGHPHGKGFSADVEQVIAFVEAEPPFISMFFRRKLRIPSRPKCFCVVVDARMQHFAWQALSSLPLKKLELWNLEGPAGTGVALAQARKLGSIRSDFCGSLWSLGRRRWPRSSRTTIASQKCSSWGVA